MRIIPFSITPASEIVSQGKSSIDVMLSETKHLAISKAYGKADSSAAPQNDILRHFLKGKRMNLGAQCLMISGSGSN